MSSNHAIVYGASAIVGWSIVDQILKRYPDTSTFSKVTAITNRPLDLSSSFWPRPDTHRPKLQLVSGFDLRDEEGPALAASLKEKVNDVEGITTIYYSGLFDLGFHFFPFDIILINLEVFTAMDDDIEEVATNLRMLRNVIDAHNILNSNLKFVTIIGGTRVL